MEFRHHWRDSILPAFNLEGLAVWSRGNYLLFMAMGQISGLYSILEFKWWQGSPQDFFSVQNYVTYMDIFLVHSVGPCLPYNEIEAFEDSMFPYVQSQIGLIWLFRCSTLFFNISALAAHFTVGFPAGEKEKKKKAELMFYTAHWLVFGTQVTNKNRWITYYFLVIQELIVWN